MEDVTVMNMDSMLELLATETSSYSRMLQLGFDKTEEFKNSQDLIISLQHEIIRRNRFSDNESISDKKIKISK